MTIDYISMIIDDHRYISSIIRNLMADPLTPSEKAAKTRDKTKKQKLKDATELATVKAELKAEKMKAKWYIKGIDKGREMNQ